MLPQNLWRTDFVMKTGECMLITLLSALHHQPKAEFTDNRVNLKVNRLGCCCFHFSQVNVTAVIKPKIPPPSSPHCRYIGFEIISTSYFSANESDEMFLLNFLMRLYIPHPFNVKIQLCFIPPKPHALTLHTVST